MTDTVRASGEAMPAINRRRFLTNTAAVSAGTVAPLAFSGKAHAAVATVLQENPAAASENPSPAMVTALTNFANVVKEFHEAREARDWIAAEWKHLWPLAPEEILHSPNAHKWSNHERFPDETDLLGECIMRDTATLTERLSPRFRRENPRTAFSLYTAKDCAEDLAEWKAKKPRGRTQKALARNTKWRLDCIRDVEIRLAKAREYEAETARVRKASGIEAARVRARQAYKSVPEAVYAIMAVEATNRADLLAKGEALAYWHEHVCSHFAPYALSVEQIGRGRTDFGTCYAADIRRLAEAGRL
jgi:hypothetical protein